MLHKWYILGKSRKFNDQFESPTIDEVLTFPYAVSKIRDLLSEYKGYKEVLYLEIPDNSTSLYKIVFTVDGYPYRLTTRYLEYVEGELEKLPNDVVRNFEKSGYRSFY